MYRDVWDGIDIEWYESNGKLEFDFVVQPGADPSQIRMSCDGLDGELSLSDNPDMSLRGLTSDEDGRKDVAISSVGCRDDLSVATETNRTTRDTIATLRPMGYARNDISRFTPQTNNNGRMRFAPTHKTLVSPRNEAKDRPQGSRSEVTWGSKNVDKMDRHVTTGAHGCAVRSSRTQVGAELLLPTSLGELRTALPQVYKISPNGTRSEVDAQFILSGSKNEFGFSLPNGYTPDHTLRIDPLVYSTYLGGNSGDVSNAISINSLDEVVITGETDSRNYPITPGVVDSLSDIYFNCFITRLSADGTGLIFSTYLGGTSGEEGTAICYSDEESILVGGDTRSDDFPTTNGTWLYGNSDGFVTKLNSSGNRIIFSTVIGGAGDEEVISIVSDSSEGCYFTGETSSPDYPTTTGAYQRNYRGGARDVYITHLSNDALDLHGSTLVGGSGIDYALNMVFDGSRLIVVGCTESENFPMTTNAFDQIYNGGVYDGYVTILDTSCRQLTYCTFIGGLGYEIVCKVTTNPRNELIISGLTNSRNFPATPGAYNTTPSDSMRGFVANLGIGSQLRFCTFYGSSGGTTSNSGLSTSSGGLLTMTGCTNCSDFPTTPDAFDRTYNGGSYDCYLLQLDSTGSHLLYSTYLGGSELDMGSEIAHTRTGDFIITGYTASTNFPMNGVGFDTTYNGGPYYSGDAFITRLQLRETAVNEPEPQLPHTFSLSQNYPNPFNSTTTLSYTLPSISYVDLRLYDLTGREIESLVNRKQQPGSYRVVVDGKNLSSGTYFVRMQAGDFVKTQKIVLLK